MNNYENKIYIDNGFSVKNKSFSLEKKFNRINQSFIDGYEIEIPEDSYTLILWGGLLKNCLADYSHKCNQKTVKLFGLKKNNQLKFIIEVKNGIITQAKGFRNSALPPLLEENINIFLKKHKLVNFTNIEIKNNTKPFRIFIHNGFIDKAIIMISGLNFIIITPLLFILSPLIIFMVLTAGIFFILFESHDD